MSRLSKKRVPLERLTVLSQAEVGRRLGITSMRVSQLERSAFKKLRAEFEKQGYELREPWPAPRYSAATTTTLAQWERERWLYHVMLVDCDLSDAAIARLWAAQ